LHYNKFVIIIQLRFSDQYFLLGGGLCGGGPHQDVINSIIFGELVINEIEERAYFMEKFKEGCLKEQTARQAKI
jgi:hypothetical protein